VTPKITTETVAIKYAQEEMRKEPKHFTSKNQLNIKEDSNAGNGEQKAFLFSRVVLGMEARALHRGAKCSITQLHPSEERIENS
jgi:hypothetical protein